MTGRMDNSVDVDETDAKMFKGLSNLLCGIKKPFTDLKLDDMEGEEYYGFEKVG